MKLLASRYLWGGLLILGGILFLLQSLKIFEGGNLFWTIVVGLVGILFVGLYFADRSQWWPLIPGIILIAVAALVGLSSYAPGFSDSLGGVIILGGIGLSFLLVYLANRSNWWALIPMGVMVTIAVVTGLSSYVSDVAVGGIFFFGLGLTFGLIAILPVMGGKMRWAWIPAGVLFAMGLVLMFFSTQLLSYMVPLVLFVIGGYIIWRTATKK